MNENNQEINNLQEKENYTQPNKTNNKKKKILIIVVIIVCLLIIVKSGLIILENYQKAHNKFDHFPTCTGGMVSKPIIYLYPTKNEEISVKLGYDNEITTSYPKYTTKWNVFAKTNGDLLDLNTNKKLYSLYYESKPVCNFKVDKNGFVVKGENITEFLEEKLAILGLNERESEEFIIYWLPKLEANKYNYIRFATADEINENMPLEINPNPDTIIRVLMTYKGLENPIDVQEQELITQNRIGFVAVEWGGTEIK